MAQDPCSTVTLWLSASRAVKYVAFTAPSETSEPRCAVGAVCPVGVRDGGTRSQRLWAIHRASIAHTMFDLCGLHARAVGILGDSSPLSRTVHRTRACAWSRLDDFFLAVGVARAYGGLVTGESWSVETPDGARSIPRGTPPANPAPPSAKAQAQAPHYKL